MEELTLASPENVSRMEELLAASISNGKWDVGQGSVIRELLIRPFAEVSTAIGEALEREGAKAGLSQGVVGDLSEEAVNNLASNFRVYRKEGFNAKGSVRIFMPTSASVSLTPGLIFSMEGLTATLEDPVSAYSGSASPVGIREGGNVNYVQMRESSQGWFFDVSLLLDTIGDVTIEAGTPATLSRAPRGMLSAVVSSPFTGGSTDESSEELAARALDSGVAAVPSGRVHMTNAVANELAIDTIDVDVTVSGDQFLLRGRSPLTGSSIGGAADVYVRTSSLPVLENIPAVSIRSGNYRHIFLDSAVAEGVVSVEGVTAPEWEVTQSQIDATYAASEDGRPLGVDTAEKARLGAYQTISIIIPDDSANYDPLDVTVRVRRYSGIGATQALFSDEGALSSPFLSVVVKAVCPISLTVRFPSSRPLLGDEETAVRTSISEAVSELPVGTGRIDASLIVNAFRKVVPDAYPLFPLDMTASAFADGIIWTSRTKDGVILAPEDSWLLHKRNRVWTCSVDSVKIIAS